MDDTFTSHRGFLLDIFRAAEEMVAVEPARLTTIGRGNSVLANRLIVRKDSHGSIYVHRWHRSDPEDFHDHPWDFVSLILKGGYYETRPDGRVWRSPGSIVFRNATDRHRVEVDKNFPFPISMIITGPIIREWGFWVAGNFIHHTEYQCHGQANP